MDEILTLSDLRRAYIRESKWLPFCALCWDRHPERELELAHIISRGRAGKLANVRGNVLLLCRDCHESHHRGKHTTASGETWPNVMDCNLIAAKAEIGELDATEIACISSRTVLWVIDMMAQHTLPDLCRRRRMVNGPMYSKGFQWKLAMNGRLATLSAKE